jgi:hypothetical protein
VDFFLIELLCVDLIGFFEPVVTAIARSLIMSPITVSALHLTNPVFLAFAALFVLLVRDELLHPHAEAESSLP